MNVTPRWDRTVAKLELIDELLVDVAVKIQLSPTLHDKAVEHYGAINKHIGRWGSPLVGKVLQFYPQGSMAIGATIRSRDEEDLFDIDLVAELDLPNETPAGTLDKLFVAINGEPGSMYHGKARRQTRCVTVDYEDMHLDVTPLYPVDGWPDRGGLISHAHEAEPANKHSFVSANPWGFAKWFKDQTPADQWFRQMVLEKSLAFDTALARAAPADPVPDHEAVFAKPLAVVALQLTKRWARLKHEKGGSKGRCIPSVVFSRMFAEHAGMTTSLADELIFQATSFGEVLRAATAKGEVIDLRNPALEDDCLTDRWPGDIVTQWKFKENLDEFVAALQAAKKTTDPGELQKILASLFGESTGKIVVEEFYKRAGLSLAAGGSRIVPKVGTAVVGLSRAPAAASMTSPGHRFWGD